MGKIVIPGVQIEPGIQDVIDRAREIRVKEFVKLCAKSLRSMLIAMGQQNPNSTKEVMQMLTKDFCIVCGAYFPSESEGPCASCLQEASTGNVASRFSI